MVKNKALFGYLMILLSALGFGSYGVWSRLIGPDFGVFYQAAIRSAMVLVVLIPLAIFTRQIKPVSKSDWKWIAIPVIFGIFTQAPLFYANNHIDIGTATLVFYSMYLITSYIVGKVFLNEKITPIKLVSLVLSFAGLLIIFGFSLAYFSLLALLLAAFNGIASGGEVSTTKKVTDKFSSLQINIYVWAGILVTHLPATFLFHEKIIAPALNTPWLAMVGFAFAGLAAFWLVIEGFKFVDASIGGLIGLFEIIFGVLFGIIIFHEHLTLSIVLGGLLIIFAAMLPDLVTLFNRKQAN